MVCSQDGSPTSELVFAVVNPKSPNSNEDGVEFFPIKRKQGSLHLKGRAFRDVASLAKKCENGFFDQEFNVHLISPKDSDEEDDS